jgi:protein-disulfide isomerase
MTNCSPVKMVGCLIINAIFTLFAYALVVNFAPTKLANLFLNPMGVVKGLQYEQEANAAKEAKKTTEGFKKTLETSKDRIFDKNAPFVGSPNAKVEIVVFADYKCGYCKQLGHFEASILSDPKYKDKVKFIQKGFPILSQASNYAAIAALQIFEKNPAEFAKLNEAFYEFKGNSKEELLIFIQKNISKKIAINFEDEKSIKQIAENLELGREIGIQGTPAIIIGDEMIGGLIPEADLRAKIDAQLAK